MKTLKTAGTLGILIFYSMSPFLHAAEPEACREIQEVERYYKGNPSDRAREQIAIVNNNCGMGYAEQKKWNTAERYLMKARQIYPETVASQNLAYVLAMEGREAFDANDFYKARENYEKALRYDPHNADIKMGLSEAVYRTESRTDKVHELFREGAKTQTDSRIRERVGEFSRTVALEKQTREEKYGNWIMRYPENLPKLKPDAIFKLIEEVHYSVGDDFQYWVKHSQIFILVDGQNFQMIHSGPGWAGALNDGRIKVPVTGLYENPNELKGVLAHEYTHTVINDFAHGNPVPFWFHEGMAEYEEYKAKGENARDPKNFGLLTQALNQNALIPFSVLSEAGASQNLSGIQAGIAYQQALSFVLFIERNYQFYSLLSLLKEIGKAKKPDEAVLLGIGRNLNFLEQEWKEWLLHS